MFKRDFRRVVVRRREGRDSVSDKDLWTHLREYLECLMWKGSLGFTNVSCKSIREATHHIKKLHARAQQHLLEAVATFISGTSGWRRSCTSSRLERTTEALDSTGWPVRADGMPHLVHIRRVVADVDLQRAGSPHTCGREGVVVLWRVHPPPHSLLLAATDKAGQ